MPRTRRQLVRTDTEGSVSGTPGEMPSTAATPRSPCASSASNIEDYSASPRRSARKRPAVDLPESLGYKGGANADTCTSPSLRTADPGGENQQSIAKSAQLRKSDEKPDDKLNPTEDQTLTAEADVNISNIPEKLIVTAIPVIEKKNTPQEIQKDSEPEDVAIAAGKGSELSKIPLASAKESDIEHHGRASRNLCQDLSQQDQDLGQQGKDLHQQGPDLSELGQDLGQEDQESVQDSSQQDQDLGEQGQDSGQQEQESDQDLGQQGQDSSQQEQDLGQQDTESGQQGLDSGRQIIYTVKQHGAEDTMESPDNQTITSSNLPEARILEMSAEELQEQGISAVPESVAGVKYFDSIVMADKAASSATTTMVLPVVADGNTSSDNYTSECISVYVVGESGELQQQGQGQGQGPVTRWIVNRTGQSTQPDKAVDFKAGTESMRSVIRVVTNPATTTPVQSTPPATGTVHTSTARDAQPDANENLQQTENLGGDMGILTMDTHIIDASGVIQCRLCPYKTMKMANLYKHKRIHMDEPRRHECGVCGHKSTTSSNLSRHMLTHSKERKFCCNMCDAKFAQKMHLKRHVQYKHKMKSVGCHLCDYRCSTVEPDLRRHMQRVHIKPAEKLENLLCDDCGFAATSKRDLSQHMKFHKSGPELKLFCQFCSYVTDCKSRLERHARTHTAEKPFGCGYCTYRSNQKDHVVRHVQSKHKLPVAHLGRKKAPQSNVVESSNAEPCSNNLMSFTCSSCQFSSAKQEEVLQHIQTQHNAVPVQQQEATRKVKKVYKPADWTQREKIHSCAHCMMKFSKALNLYKHLHLQHPAEFEDKVMTCVACPYEATTRKKLIQHMRRHNPTEASANKGSIGGSCFGKGSSDLYHCIICSYNSSRRNMVFSHMSSVHNMQILTRRDGSVYFVVVDPSAEAGQAATVIASSEEFQNNIKQERVEILDLPVSQFQDSAATDATTDEVAVATDNDHQTGELLESSMEEVEEEERGEVPMHSPDGVLSQEQLSQLASGDYVEINGEVYKVEVTVNPGSDEENTSQEEEETVAMETETVAVETETFERVGSSDVTDVSP